MSPAQTHRAPPRRARRASLAGTAALALLAGCADFDLDLRDLANPEVDTSAAARTAVENRPAPDDRGVISYPGYQVAVARRGDTVGDVAARVGLPARELARFNGAPVDARLNRGEVLALPRRVAEPSPDTGAPVDGPIRPRGEVDVATLAGAAIERAEGEGEGEAAPATEAGRAGPPAPRTGTEPLRHRVAEGETAFSIARRYDVPVEALAEWNGLDDDYTLRVGRILLIPPAAEAPRTAEAEAVAPPPGSGSPTPAPPSAAEPLPEDTAPATAADAGEAEEVDLPESPNLAEERTDSSADPALMALPVNGPIISDFAPSEGRSGIRFGVASGSPVRAAADGTVARVSTATDGSTSVVLRHGGNLFSGYGNVAALSVSEGDVVSRGDRFADVGDQPDSVFFFAVYDGPNAVDPNDFLD
jgi:murein DD-endopeptidase MepM/ murein hydrolase activator NlpD